MKTNAKTKKTAPTVFTHGGTPAERSTALQKLRRSVMSCMLWENEFYEDGVKIADRISDLVSQCDADAVNELAIEARQKMHLRHVPLWVCRALAKHGKLKANTLATVIQRADEISEFLALYFKDGKQPLSSSVKKGLAKAFRKFSEYELAKYDRANTVRLRDALFLCHAKPVDAEQEKLWKKLVDNQLASPDTWEFSLSAGKDKKDTFERLMSENKLGYMALLRNLRKMEEVGVDEKIIRSSLLARRGAHRVLPFRFVTAAKHARRYEDAIDQAMLATLQQKPKLSGKTVVVVDVSGSMYGSRLSSNSEVDRATVACALASFLREVCEHAVIYATAGNDSTRIHKTELVPARHGLPLIEAIYKMSEPLGGGGIFLKPVCDYIREKEKDVDRMIVVTDEQDCSGTGENAPSLATPLGKNSNYLINVSSSERGIGFGKWTRINGWSDAVIDYIFASEGLAVETVPEEDSAHLQ